MANPTLPARRTKSAAAAAAHDAEDRSHAKTEAQAESAGAAETTTGGGAVEEITTVSRACAFGDAARLRELVAASGSQSVCAPDAEGYYPLQWASLNDQAAMVELLIEEFHVDVNARDAGTGQAAMHWAATRGCERAVIALAERGANLATRDGRGYTPAHVAAQYGQTRLLYFMHVRYGVDVCGPLDDDGRSPLHWSAYKGHGDVTRLLIFLGADVRGRDRERCTPLHWAAVMGQGHICHIILQAASAPLFGRDDDADASSALDESDDLSPLAAEAHDAKGARVWGAGGRGRGGDVRPAPASPGRPHSAPSRQGRNRQRRDRPSAGQGPRVCRIPTAAPAEGEHLPRKPFRHSHRFDKVPVRSSACVDHRVDALLVCALCRLLRAGGNAGPDDSVQCVCVRVRLGCGGVRPGLHVQGSDHGPGIRHTQHGR